VREHRRAIEALAASERPDNEVAGELAAALRTLHREVGGDRAELDELVAELEATAYNPRAGAEPLPEPLRRRCRELAARLAGDRGSRTRPGRGAAATLIALSLAGAAAVRAEDAGDLDRARVVYREALAAESEEAQVARFGEAAALLAAAVARTPDRPGLLTDWGNAALGARDLGRAALAYRRALALDRGDRRAARNLAWVRDSLPDWAPTPGDEGAIDSLLFWHRRWSVEGRHIGAALAFAATLLLLMPWGRRREPWLRRVAAIPALMFVGLLGSALLEPDRGGEAVVIEDGAVLRSADSPHAPAALERPLPAGLEVTVVEEREQWREIALADGRRGWLPRAAIERVEL
jgi:hypothetical protein